MHNRYVCVYVCMCVCVYVYLYIWRTAWHMVRRAVVSGAPFAECGLCGAYAVAVML